MWVLDLVDDYVTMLDEHVLHSLIQFDVAWLAGTLKPSIFRVETHLDLQQSRPHYEKELLKMRKTESKQCLAKFRTVFEKPTQHRQLKVMGIGDSQVFYLMERMKESQNLLRSCLKENDAFEMDWTLLNVGIMGCSPLLYFTELNKMAEFHPPTAASYNLHYKPFTEKHSFVLDQIQSGKPDLVFFIDVQFANSKPDIFESIIDRYSLFQNVTQIFGDAFIKLIEECAKSGTQYIYLFTGAPARSELQSSLKTLHQAYKYVLKKLEENSLHLNLQNDLTVIIFNWHKFICPTFNNMTTSCPAEQYGFRRILPDTVHPEGMSGAIVFFISFHSKLQMHSQIGRTLSFTHL